MKNNRGDPEKLMLGQIYAAGDSGCMMNSDGKYCNKAMPYSPYITPLYENNLTVSCGAPLVCMCVCSSMLVLALIHTYMHSYTRAYIHMLIWLFIHTYTCIHTDRQALICWFASHIYIHTHIHRYIPTYMHTHIHEYADSALFLWVCMYVCMPTNDNILKFCFSTPCVHACI